MKSRQYRAGEVIPQSVADLEQLIRNSPQYHTTINGDAFFLDGNGENIVFVCPQTAQYACFHTLYLYIASLISYMSYFVCVDYLICLTLFIQWMEHSKSALKSQAFISYLQLEEFSTTLYVNFFLSTIEQITWVGEGGLSSKYPILSLASLFWDQGSVVGSLVPVFQSKI